MLKSITNEADILDLIAEDPNMMEHLRLVESLHLPDWAIGAGFLRNKVWDALHGYTHNTPPTDIDVVYFDRQGKFDEEKIQRQLVTMKPEVIWEVVNQATAHSPNQEGVYTSTEDALSRWPETATAVGITLHGETLRLIAPHGIYDLVNMIVRPTPAFSTSPHKKAVVQQRVTQKQWAKKWPRLRL